jgi:hypothetical protein
MLVASHYFKAAESIGMLLRSFKAVQSFGGQPTRMLVASHSLTARINQILAKVETKESVIELYCIIQHDGCQTG